MWNEPNLYTDLSPQLVDGRPVSPAQYRAMVNAVAAAVKGVDQSNLVVAGGLAPFRDITPETYKQDADWGPLSFMRDLLCLSASLKPTIVSTHRVRFWVTEFSWDSKPPDPKGVPTSLLMHWVAEALYRMWADGVTLVTWFSLNDDLPSQSYFQSGLYYHDGTRLALVRQSRCLSVPVRPLRLIV